MRSAAVRSWDNTSKAKDAMGSTGIASHSSTYSDSLSRLGGLQKTAKGAPAYSRFINRRVGRHLAAAAHARGMSPNQVTALSAFFSLATIACLAVIPPSWALGVGVCLGLLVGYALDSADGQVARLRGGGSPSGEWLDHVVDSFKTASLHAAVLVCMFRYFEFATPWPLLVPIGFGAVASVWFFAVFLTDQLRRAQYAAAGTPVVAPDSNASVVRSLLVAPTDYGVLCLTFLFLGATGFFFAIYAALLAGYVVFLLAAMPKWYREVKSFGAPGDPTRGGIES